MTCAILGISEGGIRCVLNGDPCSEPSFLGRSRSGVASQWPCQASIFHDTRLASMGFANHVPGALEGHWQSNLYLMSASRLPFGRVLCRRHQTRDARSRCMNEAQQPTYSSTCKPYREPGTTVCTLLPLTRSRTEPAPVSPVSPPQASSLLEKPPDFAKSARWITSAGYSKVAFSRTKDPPERHAPSSCEQAANQATAPTANKRLSYTCKSPLTRTPKWGTVDHPHRTPSPRQHHGCQ